jgi:hypothetical protein
MWPIPIHHGLAKFTFAVDHGASSVEMPPAAQRYLPGAGCVRGAAGGIFAGVADLEQKVNKKP